MPGRAIHQLGSAFRRPSNFTTAWEALRSERTSGTSPGKVGARLSAELDFRLVASADLFDAMVAFNLPSKRKATREDARRIRERLAQEHRIEAAVTTIGEFLYLRLSCFAYNEGDDYIGVSETLSDVLRSDDAICDPRPK